MFSESMEVSAETIDGILLITIAGRLDTNTASSFDAQLAPVLAQSQSNVLVDLGDVNYVSSAGLRSILQLVKHTAAHGGRVGLFGTQPHILEVIEMSGFPALLDLYPDRESALSQSAS
jgi:anti-anti-sigma factor